MDKKARATERIVEVTDKAIETTERIVEVTDRNPKRRNLSLVINVKDCTKKYNNDFQFFKNRQWV
ncbi:hypothetical protein [Bacillus sp. RS11]|uniref:hypothetical protein n=1 Tax=Lysinibacillus sp. RS11 TaxID=3242682 RepID=UPI0035C73D09